ncbi:VanZ family protein [Enterococcus faecium]|nr:VanZ family protein [Enterococcus faecium]
MKCDIIRTIYVGIKYVFLFSLSIEFTQLFFRLGTFQLSDLFYNTLGA